MFWSVLDVIESEMSAKGTGWDLSPSSLSLPSPALAPPGSTTCFLQAGLTIRHYSISPIFITHSSKGISFTVHTALEMILPQEYDPDSFSLVCVPLMGLVKENYTRLRLDTAALSSHADGEKTS